MRGTPEGRGGTSVGERTGLPFAYIPVNVNTQGRRGGTLLPKEGNNLGDRPSGGGKSGWKKINRHIKGKDHQVREKVSLRATFYSHFRKDRTFWRLNLTGRSGKRKEKKGIKSPRRGGGARSLPFRQEWRCLQCPLAKKTRRTTTEKSLSSKDSQKGKGKKSDQSTSLTNKGKAQREEGYHKGDPREMLRKRKRGVPFKT